MSGRYFGLFIVKGYWWRRYSSFFFSLCFPQILWNLFCKVINLIYCPSHSFYERGARPLFIRKIKKKTANSKRDIFDEKNITNDWNEREKSVGMEKKVCCVAHNVFAYARRPFANDGICNFYRLYLYFLFPQAYFRAHSTHTRMHAKGLIGKSAFGFLSTTKKKGMDWINKRILKEHVWRSQPSSAIKFIHKWKVFNFWKQSKLNEMPYSMNSNGFFLFRIFSFVSFGLKLFGPKREQQQKYDCLVLSAVLATAKSFLFLSAFCNE